MCAVCRLVLDDENHVMYLPKIQCLILNTNKDGKQIFIILGVHHFGRALMGNDLYGLPSSHWSTWKLILHYYPIMIDWKMWLCVSIRWLLLPIVNMIYMWFLFYFDNYHFFFFFFFLSKKYMWKSIFGLNLYSLISRYSIRSTHEKDFPHSNILIPSNMWVKESDFGNGHSIRPPYRKRGKSFMSNLFNKPATINQLFMINNLNLTIWGTFCF